MNALRILIISHWDNNTDIRAVVLEEVVLAHVQMVTNTPNRIAVCINKQSNSYHIIRQTGVMNVNCLSVDAPFSVFRNFGFQSGRTADKFAGEETLRSDNGHVFLPKYINAFMSLKVEQYVDLDTHGMFICTVTEARVISDRDTMTYTYYQNNVKPKPQIEGKKGYVCKVCGYWTPLESFRLIVSYDPAFCEVCLFERLRKKDSATALSCGRPGSDRG